LDGVLASISGSMPRGILGQDVRGIMTVFREAQP